MTAFRPCPRSDARRFVAEHHSHHRAHVGEVFAIGLYDADLLAVVVVGRPVAVSLDDASTLEVTRLCVGPSAPPFAASQLLGRAWRAASAMGCERLVSYTRLDERGTCYRAAGWVPTALVEPRPHDNAAGGNRASRWLPGMFEPSTEPVWRVRWEIGPGASTGRIDVTAERQRRCA